MCACHLTGWGASEWVDCEDSEGDPDVCEKYPTHLQEVRCPHNVLTVVLCRRVFHAGMQTTSLAGQAA